MDAMFVSVDAGGLFHNFEFIESLAHDTHPLIIANSIIVIELYRKQTALEFRSKSSCP